MTDKTPAASEAGPEKGKSGKIDWLGEVRGLALMLLAVVAFHSLLAKPFYIPSISMMPNLLVGDRLVVSKYPYGWNWASVSFHLFPRGNWRVLGQTPEYGDIVIVVPRNREEDLIKRVVALPGDRIAVLNGQIILRPFTRNGNSPHSVDHTALPFNTTVQQAILGTLGVPCAAPCVISTNLNGLAPTALACAVNGCLNVIFDPVEGFVVDGLGRRLGFSAATGALTEIPGSVWFGNSDGIGWISVSYTHLTLPTSDLV